MNFVLSQGFIFGLQAVSAVVMIVLVMMQAKGSAMPSFYGGDGGVYRSKRGVEKIVFNLTIVFSGVFLLSSFLSLYAK